MRVLLIVDPALRKPGNLLGEQVIPTRPEEIGPKAELVREMLAVTADHPQTLGYWTFDEIENHLYKAYEAWEEEKDAGLAEWIARTMGWTYEVFRAGDPTLT